MSTRIPLPGNMIDTLMKGVDTGSTLYSRAVQPIIEREKQKQLEQHFQEQLKLSKAAAARNASLMPYRLQELQDKHAAAQFERNMMNQLMGAESGGGDMGGGMGGGSMPGAPAPQMPTEEMGQGQGAFTPEGLAQAQQALSAPQGGAAQGGPQSGGANNPLLQKLMQNPMMRGWFKHKFGYDPLAPTAQTPEDKQAMALDLFKQKEELKKQNKGGAIPTNAVLTQNQQAIQGIDTVVPMLDELLESKNIPGIMDFSPGKKAAYNAKTSSMIDTLIAAQSLPKVQASIDLVEEQIRRKAGETVKDYKNRLQDLRDDLIKRRSRSKALLENRQVNTGEMPAQEKTLGGVKYRKIDGEWHEVE